jgi:hypothetical protein
MNVEIKNRLKRVDFLVAEVPMCIGTTSYS